MSKNENQMINLAATGQAASGETQQLDVQVKVQAPRPKKLLIEAEEEYLLINKIPEAGVQVKGRLLNQENAPSMNEKLLFMIGEACWATAHQIQGQPDQPVDFDGFMQGLTNAVKQYRS